MGRPPHPSSGADGSPGTPSPRQDEPVPHTIRYAVADDRIEITLENGSSSCLWWATKNEWLGLIDVAGLEVESLYGRFDRQPLDDDSREYVFITSRPGR